MSLHADLRVRPDGPSFPQGASASPPARASARTHERSREDPRYRPFEPEIDGICRTPLLLQKFVLRALDGNT